MLPLEHQDEFNQRFSLLRLIAFSMASGMLMSVVVVRVALRGGAASGSPFLYDRAPENLRQGLYLAALLAAAAAAAIQRSLLSEEALKAAAEEGASALIKAVSNRLILLLALCEGVGTLGLVLFVLSQRVNDLTAFTAASLLGFLWLWPRQDAWERRIGGLLPNQ